MRSIGVSCVARLLALPRTLTWSSWALLGSSVVACADDHEYVLVSGAGPEVQRDAWLDHAQIVTGDGATRFVSELPERIAYEQPAAPRIVPGVELRGLPRAVLDASRVYSLSIHAGLVVTDVSEPLAPRVVARQPLHGEPVGLVVQGGIAHVLVNDPSFLNARPAPETRCGDDGCEAPQSRIVSIDAREPDGVRISSEHVLRGAATSAHRIGDALYVVSQSFEQPGYESFLTPTSREARSVVTSFDLADPAAVTRNLELSFEGFAHREFSFGSEHLYLVEQLWPTAAGVRPPELRVFDLSTTGAVFSGTSAPLPTASRFEDLLASWTVLEAGSALHVQSDAIRPRLRCSSPSASPGRSCSSMPAQAGW